MIQVRKSRYRGQDGWTVCGYANYPDGTRHGWPTSVFFEHETAARRYASQLKAGVAPGCLKIDWNP